MILLISNSNNDDNYNDSNNISNDNNSDENSNFYNNNNSDNSSFNVRFTGN